MLSICIKIVAGLGVLGIILGIQGVGEILIAGCVLIGSALVAAAIKANNPEIHS